MVLHHALEKQPTVPVAGHFSEYYIKLKKNLSYLRERLLKFRSQRVDLWNRNKVQHSYEAGQIVYMFQAKGSLVNTGS